MVSSPAKIKAFNPSPNVVTPTIKDASELSPSELAGLISRGHPKSVPVKTHKGMEGQRTGRPHLTPHTMRYREAHARVGTKVEPEKMMT